MARLIKWVLSLGLCLAYGLTPAVAADWSHATALNGTPKYAPGFAHFDYANPKAPKGGQARLAVVGSFDTLNPVPDKGQIASGMALVFETLMTSSLDELPISAEYGLLAESISYPDDFSSVSFRLNANAKWHDGVPVTPEDVIFSFDAIKKHSAVAQQYYANVVKAEKTGDREVKFTFDMPGNRELPHIMGQITIYPKHWWEGTDEKGEKRDIGRGTLEKPLGSGPYRVLPLTKAARSILNVLKIIGAKTST
jgi:microcin C transport system substrate-binding protein